MTKLPLNQPINSGLTWVTNHLQQVEEMSSSSFTMSLLSLFLYLALPFIAQAIVFTNGVSLGFKYINQGSLGEHDSEYGADYRAVSVFESPFQLIFYNTTPNAFTLAIRMGVYRSRSVMRWVWEANRGNPVRDNATLVFGANGNLVLSDADGRVAWQTNTANKGVVGFKLLPNGNLVLHDQKNKFIWQSFDYPTDTLLVGQSLRASGPTKIVSRASEKIDSNGPYSMVLEPKGLALYYKTKNSPKPYLYYSYADLFFITRGSLNFVRLNCSAERMDSYGFDLTFEFQVVNATDISFDVLDRLLAKPRYNSTLTYLRLGLDGNVKLHTYYAKIIIYDDDNFDAWEVTYALFSKDSGENECHLPERCGNFGLCEDSQCVACPTPNGLTGWSKYCEPPKLSSCGMNNFHYYKLEGVDHFSSKYTKGDGPMKENECMNKCSKNCKCLGYFYHQTTSRCWAVNDLKTLTKVANSTHVGYIKAPNH